MGGAGDTNVSPAPSLSSHLPSSQGAGGGGRLPGAEAVSSEGGPASARLPCPPVAEGSGVGRVPRGRGGGSWSVLFEATLEVGGADVAAPHGALHVLLKQASVVLKDLGSLFVQGVFGVWLQEEVLQTINYRVYC